ncbi:Uncharacterized protein GBIM_15111 [Gryllus bimaculatus]|nr:Uncharacterized protein GBIM_15111 [Gryllus bimaculatus]
MVVLMSPGTLLSVSDEGPRAEGGWKLVTINESTAWVMVVLMGPGTLLSVPEKGPGAEGLGGGGRRTGRGLHRAHNVALEANGHALRERVAQLLAKAQHDKQLAQAVTEQVNAAETQVRNRERKLELISENFAQERRMLQQQLVRSKSVAAHLQGVLAEKEKVLKDLSGCSREIDERESARLRAKNRGNVSSATRAREDRARAAMLRVVLNGRSAERARLQHLVDHLDRRMADKQQELHATSVRRTTL